MDIRMEEKTYVTANISIDFKRVRKYDRIVQLRKRRRRWLIPTALVFLLGTVGLFWYGWYIPGSILGILLLLTIVPIITNRRCSNRYLSDIYMGNPLLPAVVRKTKPLTILAMAPLFSEGDAPTLYGCREFAVRDLPGHTLRPGERIPCVGINYGRYYEVHPLCCATDDMENIRRNEDYLKTEEWEALEHLMDNLPDKDLDLLHILDENFNYLYSRAYYQESDGRDAGETIFDAELYTRYTKQYDDIISIDQTDPYAKEHQRLLDLGLTHQVYEYLFRLDENDQPRYFTYAIDPVAFLKKQDRFEAALAEGEVPLMAGRVLATTRGVWMKGAFTPWAKVSIENILLADDMIQTKLNGKELASFSLTFDEYHLPKEQVKEQKKILGQLEKERLTRFWNAIAGRT